MKITAEKIKELEQEAASKEPMSLERMLEITRALKAHELTNLDRINREIEERSFRSRIKRLFRGY